MGRPATPLLFEKRGNPRQDPVYGRESVLSQFQGRTLRGGSSFPPLMSWDEIPLIHRPAVLTSFGFKRYLVVSKAEFQRECGWADYVLAAEGVTRGELDQRTSALEFR